MGAAPEAKAGPDASTSASTSAKTVKVSGADTPGKTAPAVAPVPPVVAALNHALELYRTGRFGDAIDAYKEILKSEPDIPMAYIGIARSYLKQKNPQDAYTAASKALQMSPHLGQAHVAMGEVYFRQGKIAEAETEFTTVAKTGVDDARAYLGLARVYLASAYYRHAVLCLNRAHELDPDDPEIQEEWIFTLPRSQRIVELKKYLGEEEDEENRDDLSKGLTTMEDDQAEGRYCHLVGKVKSTQIPLENLLDDPGHLRGVGLKVHMGGASGTLLLDTGAPGILIDRKIAEKAGVKRLVEYDINGIGDKKPMGGYIGVAESIKIGDLEFADCHVHVSDQRKVMDDDGLIGANMFDDFLVDIDIPNHKLNLNPLPERPALTTNEEAMGKKYPNTARLRDRYVAPEMKDYQSVFLFGHQLLIATRVNDLKADARLFMIDTGSWANTISPDAAREVTKVHNDSDIEVRGLNGKVAKVYSADNVTLYFSHFYQKLNDLVSIPTTSVSDRTGTEVSGFLGFAMLRLVDIKIDYRDGLVKFDYKDHLN
jgi:tetratricopeptide (TPR) repeat protein